MSVGKKRTMDIAVDGTNTTKPEHLYIFWYHKCFEQNYAELKPGLKVDDYLKELCKRYGAEVEKEWTELKCYPPVSSYVQEVIPGVKSKESPSQPYPKTRRHKFIYKKGHLNDRDYIMGEVSDVIFDMNMYC
jgi:hypothetical protein